MMMIVVAPIRHEEFRTWRTRINGRRSSHDRSDEIVWDRDAREVATRRIGGCSVADGAMRSVKAARHDYDNLIAMYDAKIRSKVAPQTLRIYTLRVCIFFAENVALAFGNHERRQVAYEPSGWQHLQLGYIASRIVILNPLFWKVQYKLEFGGEEEKRRRGNADVTASALDMPQSLLLFGGSRALPPLNSQFVLAEGSRQHPLQTVIFLDFNFFLVSSKSLPEESAQLTFGPPKSLSCSSSDLSILRRRP
jgi:hypothetical protein